MAICLGCAFPIFILGAALTLGLQPNRSDLPPQFWIFIRIGLAAGGLVLLYRLYRAHRHDPKLVTLTNRPLRGWWKLLLAAALVVAAADVAQSFAGRLLHFDPDATDPMVLSAIRAGGWPLVFLIVGALLVAPLGEEILFRGLLLGRFGAYGYWRSGVVVSTVLFALAHGSPENTIGLLAGGLVMAWLYRRTQSLWPSIALHALNNCAAFVLVIVESLSKPLAT